MTFEIQSDVPMVSNRRGRKAVTFPFGDMDVGDSSVAAILDENTDFVGSQFPHIVGGTNIIATLDYDGAGGTAAADFTLVMVFTEG